MSPDASGHFSCKQKVKNRSQEKENKIKLNLINAIEGDAKLGAPIHARPNECDLVAVGMLFQGEGLYELIVNKAHSEDIHDNVTLNNDLERNN